MSIDLGHRWTVVAAGHAAYMVFATTVYAAVNPRGYTNLTVLDHPFAGTVFACAVMIVIIGELVSRRLVAILARIAGVLVGGIAAYGGFMVAAWDMAPVETGMLASSAEFSVIGYQQQVFFSSPHTQLRIRKPDGLFTREAGTNLACFAAPISGAGPQWLLDNVRFTGRTEIEIRLRDGTVTRLAFDPENLQTGRPFDRCTGAPDPTAAD